MARPRQNPALTEGPPAPHSREDYEETEAVALVARTASHCEEVDRQPRGVECGPWSHGDELHKKPAFRAGPRNREVNGQIV